MYKRILKSLFCVLVCVSNLNLCRVAIKYNFVSYYILYLSVVSDGTEQCVTILRPCLRLRPTYTCKLL